MKRKITAAALALTLTIATPFVGGWEGLSLKPYKDIVGVKTVCYGETRVDFKDLYTKAECDAMLSEGLDQFYAMIDGCLPVELSPKSRAAFLSLAYNVGPGAVCKPSNTIPKALAARDYEKACRAIALYNKAGGKVVNGLVRRRNAEVALCIDGLR